MSHDPLLDKFREVRALLVAFKNTLLVQKRFTVETASLYSSEDKAFWILQEEHERLKHSGIDPAASDRMMEMLSGELERWSRLCKLAESGEPIGDDLIRSTQ